MCCAARTAQRRWTATPRRRGWRPMHTTTPSCMPNCCWGNNGWRRPSPNWNGPTRCARSAGKPCRASPSCTTARDSRNFLWPAMRKRWRCIRRWRTAAASALPRPARRIPNGPACRRWPLNCKTSCAKRTCTSSTISCPTRPPGAPKRSSWRSSSSAMRDRTIRAARRMANPARPSWSASPRRWAAPSVSFRPTTARIASAMRTRWRARISTWTTRRATISISMRACCI